MLRATVDEARPVIAVKAADAVGSAIAHRLHAEGFAVVLLDDVDPAWTRRGRSYVDAWYFGVAELAGTLAVFCGSVRSIPSVLDRGRAIAATTWSAGGVAAALHPLALVDARPDDAGSCARRVMVRAAAGTGFAETPIAVDASTLPAFDVLTAPASGRFQSGLSIGAWVDAGEPIGAVGTSMLFAGSAGRLLGLSARGARVARGDIVAEIDPAVEPAACFGLEPEGAGVASQVLERLRSAQTCAERVG